MGLIWVFVHAPVSVDRDFFRIYNVSPTLLARTSKCRFSSLSGLICRHMYMPATSLVGKQTNEGTPGIQILSQVQSIEMRRKFIFPAFNIHCFRIIKLKEDHFAMHRRLVVITMRQNTIFQI